MIKEIPFTKKLTEAKIPAIFCADMDGTLFTAGWEIIEAPLYNIRTAQILKHYHIPFVLVTGRSGWNIFSDYEMLLHGLPFPDTVITATGTKIFERNISGKLEKDTTWEQKLNDTKVTKSIGKGKIATSWDNLQLLQFIKKYFDKQQAHPKISSDNNFIIRINISNFEVVKLTSFISSVQNIWVEGVHIIATEKLRKKNSLDIFSGSIILMPAIAGKDMALQYVLHTYGELLNKKIPVFIFGDASIDIPMLTMKEKNKLFSFHQYAVHPTPLTKKILSEKYKERIINDKGPQAILKILKNYDKNISALSPSQNSTVRQFIKPFESILDTIINKELTPNDISYGGLEKVVQGVNKIQSRKTREKYKGLYFYILGTLADGFDGIRARQTHCFEENGQLVDVFCDRTKEFYQLFVRAKKRFINNQGEGYQTLLAAMSCMLPSIARAQAEIENTIVKEKDEKGGSMFHRTKLLFISLLYEIIGNNQKSFQIDQHIYNKNIETYKNRLKKCTINKKSIENIHIINTSPLQKKAVERFLLLTELFEQENSFILNFLKPYPQYLHMYKKEFEKAYKIYLSVKVNQLRKNLHFKDYEFQLNTFI